MEYDVKFPDLNDYDFTANPDIWEYRKLPDLEPGMSEEDEEMIKNIEAQLAGI